MHGPPLTLPSSHRMGREGALSGRAVGVPDAKAEIQNPRRARTATLCHSYGVLHLVLGVRGYKYFTPNGVLREVRVNGSYGYGTPTEFSSDGEGAWWLQRFHSYGVFAGGSGEGVGRRASSIVAWTWDLGKWRPAEMREPLNSEQMATRRKGFEALCFWRGCG